jgi:hypothetical protein
MARIWSDSRSGLRQKVWLIGAFATLSALPAALGLFGVVAHSVALAEAPHHVSSTA